MAINVKFLKGTADAYAALNTAGSVNADTFYHAGNDHYLGTLKLSNATDVANAVSRISTNESDISTIKDQLKALTEGDASVATLIDNAIKLLDAEKSQEATKDNGYLALHITEVDGKITEISGSVDGTKYDAAGEAAKAKAAAVNEIKDYIGTMPEGDKSVVELIADAKKAGDDAAEAASDAAKAAKDAQDDVDALEELVGTIPEGATATTVIGYVNEKTAGIATDANLQALSGRVDTVESAIETLNGADTLEGSVKYEAKQAAQAAATALVDGAPEALDTLKEIADWISEQKETGEDGATELVSKVQKNADAIAAETARATGIEGGLSSRIEALETAVGESGSVAAQIKTEIEKLDATVSNEVAEGADGVKVTIVETDGKLVSVEATGSFANAIATAKDEAIAAAATTAQTKADAAERNAKDYADGLAGNYATAAQGAKADTALQASNITTGEANGTISVKGADVAVKGLGSAAFMESTAFDLAGSANAVQQNLETALTWGEIA